MLRTTATDYADTERRPMEAVEDPDAETAPSSEPQNAIETPPEAPKGTADMAPDVRQAACMETIQNVLATYRCTLRARLTTKVVGDSTVPGEALISAECLVLPLR